MKMLFFDFRESEREFFETNKFRDIEIEFKKEALNNDTNLTEEELNECDIISVFISSRLTSEILQRFKNLRLIVTRSSGYNHIDTDYCRKNNIAVYNVIKYGEIPVAQYTFGLLICLIRNLIPAYNDFKQGIIQPEYYEGHNLNNLTLGIIGCGAIGSAIAKIADFFNMKVICCSYSKDKTIEKIVKYTDLYDLLQKSDIISMNLPYTNDNYHLLGENEFKMMKDGVYIINTARGELIDIKVLYENLLSQKVRGAALDVLECECYSSLNENYQQVEYTEDSIVKKLTELKNVIITPHIAYNTGESINMILETTFHNISDYYKNIRTNRIC